MHLTRDDIVMKKFNDFKIEKETQKAMLCETGDNNLFSSEPEWGASDPILNASRSSEGGCLKNEAKQNSGHTEVGLEDYAYSSFKICTFVERENFKMENYIPNPTSKNYDSNENLLLVPKWIYDKSLNYLWQKKMECCSQKYNKNIAPDIYKILREVNEI